MITDPHLPVVVVTEHVGRIGERRVAGCRRHVPAHADAAEEAVLRLRREAERRARDVLRRRDGRRPREVALTDDRRARDGRRIFRRQLAVQLADDAEEVARRKGEAGAPAKRAARQIEAVGLAAELVAAETRELDHLVRFFAHDQIDRDVGLARAGADIFLAGWRLQHRAHGNRRGILPRLGPQVHFRAQIQVADVVAGPVLVHARVAIHDAADSRVVDEERIRVAIDARVEQKRSEDLRAIAEADREGAREIADVGVPLLPVRAAPIGAHRKVSARQHFARRDVPDAGVAEKCCRCRSGCGVGTGRGL